MPTTTAASGFENFTSDFNNVNIIDNPTYKQSRPYERKYWLIPSGNFLLKVGETKQIILFLKTNGELFGDAITPINFSSLSFNIKCYDQNNLLILQEKAIGDNGSIKYTFQPIDFSVSGRYFIEIEITDGNLIFSVPNSNLRIPIIVNS